MEGRARRVNSAAVLQLHELVAATQAQHEVLLGGQQDPSVASWNGES